MAQLTGKLKQKSTSKGPINQNIWKKEKPVHHNKVFKENTKQFYRYVEAKLTEIINHHIWKKLSSTGSHYGENN